jgi:hypothetical protein
METCDEPVEVEKEIFDYGGRYDENCGEYQQVLPG